ncbi:uncharacterized protein EV422DRAFT_494273 [Fimicolochytrium jonesii]|uniref:uncharacterized protein n=1 Tax=Fimicolochytrium jonesii TaxID=1396493 RepID=UPI0022FE29B1|nr:uncharacterized protein EV422DRAFT_494273 [Fimicolochytrium jonesii]KAI8823055.1 hypothetical protein EV422DRAFT_494273 [Fimicolochytrium jonesii]
MADGSDSDSDSFGPALPPHLLARKKQKTSSSPPPSTSQPRPSAGPRRRNEVAGPAMPPPGATFGRPPVDSESDDDVFGPVPPAPLESGTADEVAERIAEIEARVQRAREEEEAKKTEKPKRGDWMLVPPEAYRLLPFAGDKMMKSRQFSKKAVAADVDQSGWTETPQDRAKGSAEKRKRRPDDEPRLPTQEELETQEFIKKHNEKHRGASLMNSHSTAYLKASKFEEEDVSKRKFDREVDMKVGGARKMDSKTRASMVDEARKLDTKFSHGNKTFL